VDDIAYLGGYSLYYVRTASGQMIKVSMANTERRGDRPTWEDSVYVYWEDHSAIVLNR
jgi:putrescine transport system ATP-binding protein